MSTPFNLTEGAVEDLEEVVAVLASQSDHAALSLVQDLEHAFLFLGSWPNAGHRKPQVTEREEIRFWTTNGYSIAYDAVSRPILILCVVHGARDLPPVLTSRREQHRPEQP